MGAASEIARAGDVVRVDMRLGDVRDAKGVSGRGAEVRLQVAVCVNDERLARIYGLNSAVASEMLEFHLDGIDAPSPRSVGQ